MPSENFIINDSYNVVVIVFVTIFEVLKDFQLNTCLILKPFLVPDDFNGDHLLLFVVKTLQSLSKTSTSDLV